MSEEINQKIGRGAHDNNVIGQQNIYNGITPEKALEMAIMLFNENFPKLQEIARETAKQRAMEFCEATVKSLVDQQLDCSVLTDPDMQYVLYNAQKDYARFGTQELLQRLITLVGKRVVANDDDTLKAVINNALETAKYLSERHLDLLSIIFVSKHVVFNDISQIADTEERIEAIKNCLEKYAQTFSQANIISTKCLQNFNCLMIKLGTATECIAKIYNLNEKDVKAVIPKVFDAVHGDYGLSYTGIILAIINIEQKMSRQFDMKTWIK